MKISNPITTHEIVVPKGSILVTRTDLRGVITYANDEFLKISGFSREEVIGKAHNIIRHPDMPMEVYKDLWETIKQNRPWCSTIKNRAKSGDYYWIHTNIVPQFENGKLVEFLSVRYAPKKEAVESAKKLHAQIQNKSVTLRPTGFKRIIKKIAEFPAAKKIAVSALLISAPLTMFFYNLYEIQDYPMLIGMALMTSFAAFLNFQVIYKYSNTLDGAVVMCYKLAGKGFGNKFNLDRDDLIGDLYRGLYSLDINLSLNLAQSNQLKDEAMRLNRALDNVHSAVMVANTDLDIIYINARAKELFSNAESDIQKQLPDFKANNLLGSNIDIYHKDPSMQRNMLKELTDFYSAELYIADRCMNVIANPVLDQNGIKIGYVAEWLDRTDEVIALREIVDMVKLASAGDFTHHISETGRKGFIFDLIKNVNLLTKSCSEGLSEIARILEALAHGDLTQTIQAQYSGTFESLKKDVNLTVEKLREVIYQIQEATGTINTGANEIAEGNNDLSLRTEKQATSLEETATSMHELTSTVQNNNHNAHYANELAIGASKTATEGVLVINQVVNTMEKINEASSKIVEIISVIDGIAFQTNILALNAAVEAARAGEQGRGFAVVASEVRNLAQRAAAAAGEIKGLISDSVERVEDGSLLVSKAGRTMEEIVLSIQSVTHIMSEISAASIEQTTGIEQVNLAINQMDDVTQQNAALVEEAAAAAETLEEQARSLANVVHYFKL